MILASKRLKAIVEWIQGDILADIGCDHAYVATQALIQNKVSRAYACDIAQGPLENAKKTIMDLHLEDRISCLLMDGIQGLPEEVDVIVIAGMGAKTIEEILDNGSLHNRRFLLMPHKDVDSLRRYCAKHHLIIKRERMIYEDHYYPLMDVVYDKNNTQTLSEAQILYGTNMLKDEVYHDFLIKEQLKWNQLVNKIPVSKRDEALKRLEILNQLL